MVEALVLLAALALATLLFIFFLRRQSLRASSLDQLLPEEDETEAEGAGFPGRAERLDGLNLVLVAASVGVVVGCAVWLALGFTWVWVLAIGAVAAIITGLIVDRIRAARLHKIEVQLADSIDLMVAALRAGAGLLDSLDVARRETKRPLRPQFDDLLGRIRYGDDPQHVLADLAERVPLQSFRLFSMAQAVHWEVGGSIAGTLAAVGRFIRDRVEVRRHIETQSAQARISMIAVMCISYFIAFVSWRSDPPQMVAFLRSEFGGTLVAAVVVMQAVGIVWITRVARIDY